MSSPRRIVFDLGDKIRISPPMWPNNKLQIQPGDLTKFVPYGNGVYGYQEPDHKNPFLSAPPQEASGGTVYFDCNISKADFHALLRLLQVKADDKDYAVFTAESETPGKDGFIAQMRIVSRFALCFMFGAISDMESKQFPNQELTVKETLEAFVTHERERWGTSWIDDERLSGLFGGDGNFACEQLAFGFIQENEYFGVYRIWSRAWLVTK